MTTVAVLGGGVAGLSAAHELAERSGVRAVLEGGMLPALDGALERYRARGIEFHALRTRQ